MSEGLVTLDFSQLDRAATEALLREHQLSLTVDEAWQIQKRILKRPPTLAECVLWSIQGSEHCSYKSSRPHLKQFNTEGSNVILGPSEDAGIVEIARDGKGNRYGLAVSHESHNHPSQVVPYEGAATGVGGNVRDVTCMGAKVVAVGDSLRFGDLSVARSKWIQEGVVAGIGGYGNPLGIPNICGDVYFDKGYNENCLVTVLTLGSIAEMDILHSYAPENAEGYALILVGKPTDNSGFGGASFASGELDEKEKEKNKGAVQEPNAFLERHILKATYALHAILRERKLLNQVGFKDLGAGGIACASVELADAAGYGAEVDLEKVHVGMEGLPPHVILCSETQERFMWVVPPALVSLVLDHYNQTFLLPEVSTGAQAREVGRIRTDGMYKVTWKGTTLVEAPAAEVTRGLVYDRPYVLPETENDTKEPDYLPKDWAGDWLDLLSHENIASRQPIYESYDKQVQGAVVREAGSADAGVFKPFVDPVWPVELHKVGAAVSLDQNPRYNRSHPHNGAAWAVVEAYQNVCAVGGRPGALTDCLCYGNPEKEKQMGEFVAGVTGVAKAARSLHRYESRKESLPIVGGNVSLYNESQGKAIPPSPIIACIGVVPDAEKSLGFALQSGSSRLYRLGRTVPTLAGSLLAEMRGLAVPAVPEPEYAMIESSCFALLHAMEQGWVLSAHDISDGGLAVALSEGCIAGGVGAILELGEPDGKQMAHELFAELGGFLVEVPADQVDPMESFLTSQGVTFTRIGRTSEDRKIVCNDLCEIPLDQAKSAWENGLRSKLD